MGEAAALDYYDELDSMVALGGEDERIMEWETGLPGSDELTPLSQPLVPPGLAAAFRIPPELGRTLLDVHRASAATVSRLRRASSSSSSSSGGGGSFPPYPYDDHHHHQQQQQQPAPPAPPAGGETSTPNGGTKRPRLVWTPQLHKRFVDVVAHLGIKNAVPKTIMQLMNVEGLTRENVASHLQKYRLYVKRMRGLSNEGPSPSDHIFASTPVPHSLVHEPQQVPTPPPPYMYHHHHRVPMPMVPTANGGGGGGGGGGYAGYPQYHHHHHHHAGK